MLELFARHGRFDLICYAEGDTQVDYHHLVEDCGIVLGRAFASALGEMRGIARYGSFLLPMDEALVMAAVDISGRGHLSLELELRASRAGDFDTELAEEFLLAFSRSLGVTIHIRQIAGKNTHHIIEAVFKGLARALAQAVAAEERFADEIPSTKGTIL
jgi:imidazoleglycerol-phosphate dehydratase